MERRREQALAQRDAAIKGRQRAHAATTGKQQQDEERRLRELNDKYLADKARQDEENERTKRRVKQQMNAEVLKENSTQLARRQADKQAASKVVEDEKRRMNEATEQLRRDEDIYKQTQRDKQRVFRTSLQAQAALVADRKKQERIAMTNTERSLNQPLVTQVLATPEPRRELATLLH